MYWRLPIIIHEVGSSPMTTLVILVKWGIFPSMAHRCIFQVGESWQSSVALWSGSTYTWYPLVNKHSYWTFWFIVDLPIKMVIFHSYVSLLEGRANDFKKSKRNMRMYWKRNLAHLEFHQIEGTFPRISGKQPWIVDSWYYFSGNQS